MAASIVVAALLAGAPGAAAASGHCERVKLTVSKRTVRVGETVRVRGRVCGGSAASHRRIRIRMRGDRRWRTVGRTRTLAGGAFSSRVSVVPTSARRVVLLRAVAASLQSRTLRLRVDSDCALAGSAPSEIGLQLGGCRVLDSDTASISSPLPAWGRVDCQSSSRSRLLVGAGDPHAMGTGQGQGNDAYRRQTVFDGDDISGERCELGLNDHQTGPTALYREGQRRATYASLRLPGNFLLGADTWQTVLQMKQAQPSDAGGGVPILFMGAYLNHWHIESSNGQYWSFPAQTDVWTRFVFDAYYSQDPARGWVQVSADLDGDGQLSGEERSPVIRTDTLKTETDGPNGTSDGLAPGDPIPSHLRAGIYHNPSIDCPAPVGCSVDVDNVQILAP